MGRQGNAIRIVCVMFADLGDKSPQSPCISSLVAVTRFCALDPINLGYAQTLSLLIGCPILIRHNS